MTMSATLFTAPTVPVAVTPPVMPHASPLGSAGGSGTISGGLLRPGAIDQATFLQMLQQEQQNRQAAGVGGKPVQMPIPNFQSGIPTLTSAQFAALVGSQDDTAAPSEGPAADPQAIRQIQPAGAALPAAMAATLRLSGAANRNLTAQTPQLRADDQSDDLPTMFRASDRPQAAGVQTASAETATGDTPQIYRASADVQTAAAQTAAAQTAAVGTSDAEASDTTKSADAAKSDPNVVHLKSPPDKDQQKELRMQHKRWVVDETPGARQLFFGADGKFGWDDFLDVINPLQHIPIIAQIYRAVTGDEINGAANLLGAIPFGPLGGPGMIAAIADLAVKDVTGQDIGDNLTAMVFGKGDAPRGDQAPAPADTAQAGASTAEPVQTATRELAYTQSEASQLHQDCRG
jgi:hypothetical protein